MAEPAPAGRDDLGLRALSGDRGAFDELVRCLHRPVYGYALRVLGDEPRALEVAQDTFVRAWRYRASFDPQAGGLRAWLFAIAANRIRDALAAAPRPLQPLHEVPEAAEPQAPASAGLEAYARDAVREQVAAALESLEPEQREVIALKYLSGLSYPQIAAALGISPGAARMRALRGRDVLSRRLADLSPQRGEGP